MDINKINNDFNALNEQLDYSIQDVDTIDWESLDKQTKRTIVYNILSQLKNNDIITETHRNIARQCYSIHIIISDIGMDLKDKIIELIRQRREVDKEPMCYNIYFDDIEEGWDVISGYKTSKTIKNPLPANEIKCYIDNYTD